MTWTRFSAPTALLTLAALSFQSSLVLDGFLFSTLLVVIAVAAIGGTRPTLTGSCSGSWVVRSSSVPLCKRRR